MTRPENYRDWKPYGPTAHPLLVDGVLVYTIWRGHPEKDYVHAWEVIDEDGIHGWCEFEHHSPITSIGGVVEFDVPDKGSLDDRLVRRLRALRAAIDNWKANRDQRLRGSSTAK
jgi:hypothetical protein